MPARSALTQHDGFVLDASATIAAAIPDEWQPLVDRVLSALAAGFALVPMMWHFEIANVMGKAVRAGRLGQHDAEHFLRALRSFDIRTDAIEPHSQRLLAESQHCGLTAYDTSYLLLARDRGLPLATLDSQLAAAAQRVGVPLVA